MISLDNYRVKDRLLTLAETREYYNKVVQAIAGVFDFDVESIEYTLGKCESLDKTLVYCMVAIDMQTTPDIICDAELFSMPKNFLEIVGKVKEKVDEPEPKACVICLEGNRKHE